DRRGVGLHECGQVPGHVVGGELFTVADPCVVTQVEGPGQAVLGGFPVFRQRGCGFPGVRVDREQLVVDVSEDVGGDRELGSERVEGIDLLGDGDGQCVCFVVVV